jgi:serine/threonine protein kinase
MAGSNPGEFAGTERFQVLGRLGEGGFGVVYRAFDRTRNIPVALKTLRRVAAKSIYRFKHEFRALTDVAHPNLVTLFELLQDGGEWFFTMELVDGVNFVNFVREGADLNDVDSLSGRSTPTSPALDDFFKRAQDALGPERLDTVPPGRGAAPQSALNERLLRLSLRQLAEGVTALHDAGMLHRDIKASNVLVTRDGRVVVLDFGLVKELAPEPGQTRDTMGTPSYMSPEQVEQLPLTPASDWYSVGVLMYEALTGRLPFAGDVLKVLRLKLETEPLAPRDLAPGIPEDLNALCCELMLRDPEKRPSGRDVLRRLESASGARDASAAAPPPRRAAPFVNRNLELAALREAFEAMKQGRTLILSVHGASGMGKSALIRHFLEDVPRTDPEAVVLSGRCYERESVPYKALDALVDSLSQYLKRLPEPRAEALLPRDALALARLFPVLLQVPAVASARPKVLEIPDDRELRRRGSAALRDLLVRLADRNPLVLFVDDVHWGDLDSAALVVDLLRPPDPPAVLLLSCFRSGETETSPLLAKLLPLRDSVGPALDIREVVVRELPPAESRELATALLGIQAPFAATQSEAIFQEAGGSPFFIGRLPDEARRLLEVVAVAGRPVDLAVAARAAAIEGRDQAALAPLRAGHWVWTHATPDGGEEIEAYHDRIRALVVGLLTPETLGQHHRRLAVSLSASARADPEQLAVHFQEAGDHEIAAKYAAAAAAQAAGALAFDRATRLYRLALELHSGEEAESQRLRVALGEALANAGRGADAARAYLAAASAAGPAEGLELQRRAAEQFLIAGHIDLGLAAIRTVLAQVGMSLAPTPRRALLRLLLRRAQLRLRGLRFRERDASRVSDQDLMRIDTCWSVVVGLSVVDRMQGAYFQARHLLFALAAGEPYRIARALALEAGQVATDGAPARRRVERLLETAAGLAERVNHPNALGLVTMTGGIAASLRGEWKLARDLTERAESIFRERCTGVTWELRQCHLFSLISLFELGELDLLSRRVDGFLVEARERGDLWTATSLRTRVAYVRFLADDDPEAARRDVQQAIERWPAGVHLQHLWHLFAQGDIDLYSGRYADAWKRIEEHWPILQRGLLMRVRNTRILSLYLRARSALAMAGAGQPALLAAAERDSRSLKHERTPWADPLAGLLLAGVAVGRREPERAVPLLGSAEEGFAAADMALHAACARRLRGELLAGEEGRALVTAADAWMVGQRIRNPARMAAMLAPMPGHSSAERT